MKKIFHFVVYVLVTLQGWCYPSFVAPSGQTIYYQIVDGSVQIVHHNLYTYLTGNLVIPDSISHYYGTRYAVTSIGNSAFQYCAGLTSVSFPATITHIGDYAFYHCGALSSCSFAGDSVLIGQSAFGCSGLVSLYFNNTFVSISQDAFEICNSLTTVNIAKGSIGQGAFSHCENLFNVSIDSCSVGDEAFEYCYSLSSVLFGDGVSSIGSYAFVNDTSLSSVTIPNGVTHIEYGAFHSCNNLDTVYLPTNPPIIGSHCFSFNSEGRVFILPGCLYDTYCSFSLWGDYSSSFIEPNVGINIDVSSSSSHGTATIIPFGTLDVNCDSTAIIVAYGGYYHFDHWSNGSHSNPDTLHLIGDTNLVAYFVGCTLNPNRSLDFIR